MDLKQDPSKSSRSFLSATQRESNTELGYFKCFRKTQHRKRRSSGDVLATSQEEPVDT